VVGLENKASGKFGLFRDKLRRCRNNIMKKPKNGVKDGFTTIPQQSQDQVQVVTEGTGGTIANKETNLDADVPPDMEPEPSTDVLEVWFSGCHTGRHIHIPLILS